MEYYFPGLEKNPGIKIPVKMTRDPGTEPLISTALCKDMPHKEVHHRCQDLSYKWTDLYENDCYLSSFVWVAFLFAGEWLMSPQFQRVHLPSQHPIIDQFPQHLYCQRFLSIWCRFILGILWNAEVCFQPPSSSIFHPAYYQLVDKHLAVQVKSINELPLLWSHFLPVKISALLHSSKKSDWKACNSVNKVD